MASLEAAPRQNSTNAGRVNTRLSKGPPFPVASGTSSGAPTPAAGLAREALVAASARGDFRGGALLGVGGCRGGGGSASGRVHISCSAAISVGNRKPRLALPLRSYRSKTSSTALFAAEVRLAPPKSSSGPAAAEGIPPTKTRGAPVAAAGVLLAPCFSTAVCTHSAAALSNTLRVVTRPSRSQSWGPLRVVRNNPLSDALDDNPARASAAEARAASPPPPRRGVIPNASLCPAKPAATV